MKHSFILAAAVIGLTPAGAAFAEEKTTSESQTKTTVEKDTDGNYHRKQVRSTKNTDTEGTTVSTETKTEIDSKSNGDGEKTVTTKTSTDPKGLLNKSTTTTQDSVKYKNGSVEKAHKRKVDGKTIEETTEESREGTE